MLCRCAAAALAALRRGVRPSALPPPLLESSKLVARLSADAGLCVLSSRVHIRRPVESPSPSAGTTGTETRFSEFTAPGLRKSQRFSVALAHMLACTPPHSPPPQMPHHRATAVAAPSHACLPAPLGKHCQHRGFRSQRTCPAQAPLAAAAQHRASAASAPAPRKHRSRQQRSAAQRSAAQPLRMDWQLGRGSPAVRTRSRAGARMVGGRLPHGLPSQARGAAPVCASGACSAQLSSAQLSSAQLSSAQLSSAQLSSAQLSSAQLSGGCDERLLAGAAMALVSHGRPRSPDGNFSETSARAALMRAARGDALMAQVCPAHCPTWAGAALGGGEQRLIARTNGRRRCARDSAVGR